MTRARISPRQDGDTHVRRHPQARHRTKLSESGRWLSDLHCLWRYCDQRSCQRARACQGDPRHCLHFLPLVPYEAREFILGWDNAQAQGLSWEEMLEEHAEEWQTLLNWQELVRDTLPENRWKERRRFEAEQRARLK